MSIFKGGWSSTVWTFRKVTILGDAILCSLVGGYQMLSVGKEVGFGWVGAVACRYAVDFRSLTAWTWTTMTSLVEPLSPFWVFQWAGTKAIPFCSMCVIPCSTWWCPPTKVPRFIRHVVFFLGQNWAWTKIEVGLKETRWHHLGTIWGMTGQCFPHPQSHCDLSLRCKVSPLRGILWFRRLVGSLQWIAGVSSSHRRAGRKGRRMKWRGCFPSEFSRISGFDLSMLKTDENNYNSFHLQSLEAAKQRTPAQFMIAVWFK